MCAPPVNTHRAHAGSTPRQSTSPEQLSRATGGRLARQPSVDAELSEAEAQLSPLSPQDEEVGLRQQLAVDGASVKYSDESIVAAFRARVGWLALFLVGLWSAAFVIDAFEHTLQRNVELAHFVPLIIGQGGNAGSQAVSVSVSTPNPSPSLSM